VAGEKYQPDTNYYFITPPVENSPAPVRIWAMGDFGSTGPEQEGVRNAYYSFSKNTYTNLMLWLGDDAYPTGTDEQYSSNVFIPYKDILSKTLVYSSTGNHDMFFSSSMNETGPYFDIFNFPRNGECGGLKSNSEAYYSFNYANIHFVCLETNIDSFGERTAEMINWLKSDLQADNSKWTIAYFHYPPYSKGYHDSDKNKDMQFVRENIIPVLEEHGTDLVLCGHDHDYERTSLIAGHFGASASFRKSMIVDKGKGIDPVVYTKKEKGTIYAIVGCMGEPQPIQKSWPHPAMAKALTRIYGAMIIDIEGNTLTARLMNNSGRTEDYFMIKKQ
jgi:hypothetical protein